MDFLARYGGEEFTIIAPDEEACGAAQCAERCRRSIEQVRLAGVGGMIQVTASFGVADSDMVPSAKALIRRADEALYRAKRAGRNRVELAPAMQQTETRKYG